jgi:hypothetical protein
MSDNTGNEVAIVGGLSEVDFIKASKENKGFTQNESIIPFTRIMQPGSPQVGTMPWITPGVFMNLATSKVNKELTVVLVNHMWNYTEWSAPAGQGGQFVKDWGEYDKGWKELCDKDQHDAYQPVTKDGHSILKARHFYILTIDEIGDFERTIFPFYATSLAVAKSWSAMVQYAPKVKTSEGLLTPAHFYYTYIMSLEEQKNNKGRWFRPKVTANIVDNKYVSVMEMPNGKAIWDAAVKMRDGLQAGEFRASSPEDEEGTF